MTGPKFDLDTLSVSDNPHGDGREVFNPDSKSAWDGAGDRIFVTTARCGPTAVVQIGYDPATDATYARVLPNADSRWNPWTAVDTTSTPLPPVGGEGEGEGEGEGGTRRNPEPPADEGGGTLLKAAATPKRK